MKETPEMQQFDEEHKRLLDKQTEKMEAILSLVPEDKKGIVHKLFYEACRISEAIQRNGDLYEEERNKAIRDEMNYEQWMRKVDLILVGRYGMSHDDLPDMRWRDEFDDGSNPEDAVSRLVGGYTTI